MRSVSPKPARQAAAPKHATPVPAARARSRPAHLARDPAAPGARGRRAGGLAAAAAAAAALALALAELPVGAPQRGELPLHVGRRGGALAQRLMGGVQQAAGRSAEGVRRGGARERACRARERRSAWASRRGRRRQRNLQPPQNAPRAAGGRPFHPRRPRARRPRGPRRPPHPKLALSLLAVLPHVARRYAAHYLGERQPAAVTALAGAAEQRPEHAALVDEPLLVLLGREAPAEAALQVRTPGGGRGGCGGPGCG
jgi:hypothetical protein